MHQLPVAPQPLAIGQSMKLPDGDGTITYTGYRQWISLAITYDPGQLPALISAILALAGLILSFLVRRRRVFVRPRRRPDGTHAGRVRRAGPVGRGGRVRGGVRPTWPATCARPRTAAPCWTTGSARLSHDQRGTRAPEQPAAKTTSPSASPDGE